MESGLIIVAAIIGCVCGIAIGIVFTRLWVVKSKTQGTIHVDSSDPTDGPYLFLELKVPVEEIVSSKRATLAVDTTQFYSHE